MPEPAQNQSQTDAATPTETPPQSSFSALARERFGGDFHGEVKPLLSDEGDAGTTQPDAGDGHEDADQHEDADGHDTTDEGGEDNTQSDDASEGDDEGDEAQSIRDLIESSEIDPEWFQGLGVDVTVNGQTTQVPFRDLVATYQMNQAAEAKLDQAKTKSAEAQQALAQKNAALEAQFATAGAIIQQAEKILTADFETIDWKTLHEEDPAEWSAQKVAFGERQQQLAALKQHLVQGYQQSVTQRQAEMSENQQAFMAEQLTRLAEEMPKVSSDWGSAETLPTAKARLSDYLLKQGFTQEDINSAADHRLLVIAEKARLHDEAKGKLDVSKKRLRRVPKVLKPGAQKQPSQVNQERVKEARNRLSRSGSIHDALDVLRAKRK